MKEKLGTGQFRVAAIGESKCTLASYNRRDFYKISWVRDRPNCTLQYGTTFSERINRPALILLNPNAPRQWISDEESLPTNGYFCVFDEAFIQSNPSLFALVQRLFNGQESPIYYPDNTTTRFLDDLFARLHTAEHQNYPEINDLYRNYLNLILHEANLMQRSNCAEKHYGSHVVYAFMHLLQQQFPIDLPTQQIGLKTASDYAQKIAVHVNHLNATVQKVTGKSTSKHISERILAEAKSLLAYTNHSVAEISNGLGFEYASYFNRFFKKHSGFTPLHYQNNFEKYH